MPISKSSTTNRTTPTSKKGRERRTLILSAAKQRLIDHGHEGLKLRELATELDITHGNLQYYFQTRSDLLTAIFDDEVKAYTDPMSSAISSASSINGKVDAIIETSLQVLESEKTKLWRVLIGIADQNNELGKILKRENDYYEKELSNVLKEISPSMSKERRAHVSKITRCLLDGLSVELVYTKPKSPKYIAFKSEVRTTLRELLSS